MLWVHSIWRKSCREAGIIFLVLWHPHSPPLESCAPPKPQKGHVCCAHNKNDIIVAVSSLISPAFQPLHSE